MKISLNTHNDKTQENKSQSVANSVYQKPSSEESTFMFEDNRPEAVAQRKFQEMVNNSPQAIQLKVFKELADKYILRNKVNAIREKPIQGKFSQDGYWMNEFDDNTLRLKLGTTTSNLWICLKDQKKEIYVSAKGSGASWNIDTREIQISKNWLDAVETYMNSNQKEDVLGDGLSSLTHELSHAYDSLVQNKSQKGKNVETDDYVIAVLETELKAWKNEALSARENLKDKNINLGELGKNLIAGWLGIHYSIIAKTDILTLSQTNNTVIGRLYNYFNKNKTTSTTLNQLLNNKDSVLMPAIVDYAKAIRDKYTSDDNLIKGLESVQNAMSQD